jgi:hypothetical protein
MLTPDAVLGPVTGAGAGPTHDCAFGRAVGGGARPSFDRRVESSIDDRPAVVFQVGEHCLVAEDRSVGVDAELAAQIFLGEFLGLFPQDDARAHGEVVQPAQLVGRPVHRLEDLRAISKVDVSVERASGADLGRPFRDLLIDGPGTLRRQSALGMWSDSPPTR